AAERFAPFEQILRLRTVRRRTVKRRFRNDVVANRNVEPRAELAQFLFVHFLLLMRYVAAFTGFAETVTFHRLGEDHRWPALVFERGLVGGINFARVVTAALQLANLVVGEMIHQFEQFGIFAEEMPARVAARLDGIFLVIAVHRLFHAPEQQAALVAREQIVPITAPNDFDDVPAGAQERGFEFLDDFAVAAHGAVQSLQIAIHDPDEVVEVLARRERERTERFRLVRFAVADKAPDLGLLRPFCQTTRLEIAIKSRL